MLRIDSPGVNDGCKLAYENHLYVDGWSFSGWFRRKDVEYICLAYYNDNLVGVGAINGYLGGIFVKEEYRKKGIGTKLIEHLISVDKTIFFTGRAKKIYDRVTR